MNPPPVRHRVRHLKVGLARFVSHIDLINYFSRLLARAGIRPSMTEGFNPKPKFEFGPALSTGIESLDERFDFFLPAPGDPADLAARMRAAGVEGLAVESVEAAPPLKLSRALQASRFRVTIGDAGGGEPALSSLLAAATPGGLEAAGVAAPGLVESVDLAERRAGEATLDYVTRHAEGRFASPRALERLDAAAGLSFRHLKIGMRLADGGDPPPGTSR